MDTSENPDPLTPNLRHVLHEACYDEECPIHHPIGAPGMNRRDLALFVAGAQEAVRRFRSATDEELGIPPDARYPSHRILMVEISICEEVGRWVRRDPPKKKKGRLTPKRRVLGTFR